MKNRSIVIATQGGVDIKSEVHLNLWKISKTHFALDIGIKLFEFFGSDITAIFVYFPYSLIEKEKKIVDLGRKLQKDSIVSTIFNDDFVSEAGPQNSSIIKYKIRGQNYNEFDLFTLGENDIEYHNVAGIEGTFVTLSLPDSRLNGITTKDNLYVRIRVNLDQSTFDYLKHDEEVSNDVFQSAFSINELYDIRLNSMRDINPKVFQKITNATGFNASFVKLEKCHFFFITTVKDKVSNGNLARMDSRMLESDKWASYIPSKDVHTYMAYHWKKKNDNNQSFDSFEVFFRTLCDNKNLLKIISYLLMAISIGSIGSLVSSIGTGDCINWLAIIITVLLGLIGFGMSFL